MKPKISDYLPFYGTVSYFRRFFKTLEKPTTMDINSALRMKYYHLVINLITIAIFFKIIM